MFNSFCLVKIYPSAILALSQCSLTSIGISFSFIVNRTSSQFEGHCKEQASVLRADYYSTSGHYGQRGVETKVNKGTCYWVWNLCDKILACMKKDPSCFRKHPEQCFLRPDLKFFLEFQKKFWFAISVNIKMTIQNYFFVKKVCKKKSPIKFVGNFLSQKEHIRAHPNEYEIYVEKYFLVWKKTRAATANNRNNVF